MPASPPPPADQPDVRERLIQAAHDVFKVQGYARATTRGIAAAAGLTEVTLFRHFGSKENLFREVVERYANVPMLVQKLEDALTGDLRMDLQRVGRILVDRLIEKAGSIQMLLCESVHFPELQEIGAQNPTQLRLALARYLEKQMEAGAIRTVNADLAAHAFIGMFFSYAIMKSAFNTTPTPDLSLDELVVQFTDQFIQGIEKH